MYDLHTHTTFSDGELIPAELIRRAQVAGYRAVAITDHVDHTNIFWVLEGLLSGVAQLQLSFDIEIIVGVELTHVPPPLIPELIDVARKNGAQVVVVHGETIVEPVKEGTNLAAIEGGADILAHPGLIKEEEVRLAARQGVFLELSTRKGHSLTNGHVASLARQYGAPLILNNDAHSPEDLIFVEKRRLIAQGAGLSEEEFLEMEADTERFIQRLSRGARPL